MKISTIVWIAVIAIVLYIAYINYNATGNIFNFYRVPKGSVIVHSSPPCPKGVPPGYIGDCIIVD